MTEEFRNKIAVLLFILFISCYSYFVQFPGNWNTVPRIGLTLAMLEDQSLSINKFSGMTRDIAYYKGKYYTDKAPGMSFMAYPFAAVTVYTLKSLSDKYGWIRLKNGKIVWVNSRNQITASYWILNQVITLFTSGLITALAALAIYFVSLKLGASLGGAVFASLAYGMGTPAWGWATAFFGHAAAGGCLFLGLTAVIYLIHSPPCQRRDILLSFLSGALLAWAVVIELTAAPASLIIALYGLYSVRKWKRERLLKTFLAALAGGLIFITPLLLYNYSILGTPFGSLYKYTVYFPHMKQGFYGLVSPDLSVFMKLLVSGKHGILWFSPLLIAVPLALIIQWRCSGQKSIVVVTLSVLTYYLLWNSSFTEWDGGGSTTPRYLTPMLPFLCLPLALLWTRSGKILRYMLLVLLTISMLISLMSVSVSMFLSQNASGNIVMTYLVPEFFQGRTPWFSLPMMLVHNSARLSGQNGQIVLIPLYLIIAVCLYFIYRNLRKAQESG